MRLVFDKNNAVMVLESLLVLELETVVKQYIQEIEHNMRDMEARQKSRIVASYTEGANQAKGIISKSISVNTWVIIDSFGTGSKMLSASENPFLGNYIYGSTWNPLRVGTRIVGRPKGNYTDIFGIPRYSTGRYAGQNLENRLIKFSSGEMVYIRARSPSRAIIKVAKEYVSKLYAQRAVERVLKKMKWENFFRYV